ncbi:catalase family protein [Microbulbifer celer]|uniref:Catalase family protein n=1 Tax=Microbulbifer celer TaxID=435905 RepID=A0ABW3UB63_9GAMM|nr:catalase family protein [Microbulbifer celer]UFN55839.1 catalase family protein [Microbulbifer celer]
MRPCILLFCTLLLSAHTNAQQELTSDALDSLVTEMGMEMSDAERTAILSSIKSAREISRVAQQHNDGPYRRDAHAKATGCLRAEFEINGDIPAEFQHSVFAEPGRSYQSWIRYSNGDMLVQPDGKGDARGMAIKLVGATGTSIAPELGATATQDFIMTNTPAFFNRNIHDYAENITHLAKQDRTGWFIGLWPPRLNLTEMLRARQTISSTIDTPLGERYFSMLPYRLGDTELKFSARPCPGARYTVTVDQSKPDFLTAQMAETLASDSACFDFMVQPRVAEGDMPLDDATVIWDEAESPFIPIARIHIPPQTFTSDAQQAFCENLSMNPWHGVGEWQPLGSLNRARRVVYHAVSEFRHRQNDAPQVTPTDWCIPDSDTPCSPQQGLNIRKPTWPLPRCFDPAFKPITGEVRDSRCDREGYFTEYSAR